MTDSAEPAQQVALLRFDGDPLLPTEIYRTTESFNSQPPEPEDFVLAPSNETDRATNYYRHFKADLSLTKREATEPDPGVWSMRTKRGDYTRLNEIIGQSDDGSKQYFTPLHAARIFLTKVVQHAIDTARDAFGEETEIRVHLTAPNYEYEGDGQAGKRRSRRYRDRIRETVDSVAGNDGRVSFEVGGTDFLYEPYGVYYYYSLLEHSVELGKVQAGKTYLVFDMGGSTTDAAIVQVNRRESDFRLYPLCTSIPCAGAYFDQYILKDLLGRTQVPRRSKKWIPYLEEIEQAKIALCEGRKDAVEIEIDEAEGGTFHLDRGRLERLLKELWTDDEKPLGPGFRGFLRRVRRLARDHGQLLDFDQIESVFLAGGSVGLPGLEDRVQEDLRRLNLLPEEAKEGQTTSTIRPRRRLFGDRVTPSSSLAALGQVASIAEKNRERILEEGEEIYALVRGPDGINYPFERQNAGSADPKYDGEFLLCTLDELEERNTVRFEPDGTDRFEDIEIGEKYPPLEEAEIYLRANVNRFQDSPDRTFSQSKENGGKRGSDSDTEEDPEETRARFTAHAELRPDRLRIKPFLWTVQPQEDRRRTLDADEDGYLSVSLRPDHPDDDTVHVGVDLGMNNTAVALYAPGRDIPNRSDLEVFTLQPTRRSVTSYLREAFPSEPLSLDDVMTGIEDAHQAIGYRPTVRGAYRLLRGAFVDVYAQSLYTGSSNELSRSEVTDRALNDVLEAMTKEAGRCRLDVSTLRREVRIARAIQQGGGDDGTTNLEALISAIANKPGAGDAFPDLDTIGEIIRHHSHDRTESQASQEPSSNGTDEGRDKRPSDTSDSPSIPNANVEDGTTPTTRDTTDSHRPSSDRSSDHWALGMTEWMEERVEQMVDPIRQSNEATREAVKELSNRLEAVSDTLENNAPETNATQDQELADAVRGVESHLEDLVSATQRRERESGTSIDVQKRIEEQIQEESEDPLAELTTGELDTSLDALKKFVEEKGYIYPEKVLRRAWMHCVSDASSLVILAGPPGCGKTSLVRLLAEFFNRDLSGDGWESYHLLQPVSPNWFSPESLLGSRSVMTGEYQYTPFLKFLLRAEAHFVKALSGPGREHARQFVACLDEFNIAQPEQYLADLLSKMEAPVDSANRRLRLGEDGAGGSVVDVDLTGNLKLFATINTDSTTKTLSPKVLDRAIYVPLSPEVDSLNQAADRFQERFEVPEPVHDQFTEVLGELAKLARAGQAPVAYRSIEQGYAYAGSHPEAETSPDAVIQDVLISFFLSKLPGAYAINDPAGTYRNQLQECNTLRQYDEVARLLDRIETGLPGQAAL